MGFSERCARVYVAIGWAIVVILSIASVIFLIGMARMILPHVTLQ